VLNYFEHPFRLYFHTLSAVFDLSIGGIAAWLCFASNNFRKCFERIRDSGRIVIWICGLLLMYINVATSSGPLQLLTKHLQVVFFAIVIVDQCFGGHGKLKLSNSRLLTNVGKYTYGVYMLHTLVLLAINTISIRVLGLQNHDFYAAVIRVVVGLPLTILVAWLSYQVFERRFLSMKEKFQFQKKVVVR
jgi:peptidoglycan/LPS O-acetylase OafA/YrhL